MTHRLIVDGELMLYGVVGGGGFFMPDGFTADEVARALAEINGDVTVRINSPGGIARDGVAIFNYLKDRKGKVTVKVDGIAASAASVIAMAGGEIIVPKSATLMIHNAAGVTLGTGDDHRKTASILGKLDGQMAGIYAGRSGQKRKDVEQMMRDETWLDGAEAVALGFADSSPDDEPSVEPVAFDYSVYAHAPERLLNPRADTNPRRKSAFKPAATAGNAKETAMAEASETAAAKPAEQVKPATATEIAAAFPDLVAAVRAEAAAAERARILGIEKAELAGHAELVATLKADGKTTPEQAALRIIEAEKAKLGKHAQAIADVESVAAEVKPAAHADAAAKPSKATTPDGWKAEYAASAELQGEFSSAEAYVAFKQGEASGRVRILNAKRA